MSLTQFSVFVPNELYLIEYHHTSFTMLQRPSPKQGNFQDILMKRPSSVSPVRHILTTPELRFQMEPGSPKRALQQNVCANTSRQGRFREQNHAAA